MHETLSDAPGVGLAAPHIGESLQLAIIEDTAEYQATLTEAELAERERHTVPFHVLINPEIQLLSPLDTTFFEGCLRLVSEQSLRLLDVGEGVGHIAWWNRSM